MRAYNLKHLSILFRVLFAVYFLTGCTRDVEPKETLRLIIPTGSVGGSSKLTLAAGDVLTYAVVNIQLAPNATPIVRQFEYHENGLPAGSSIVLNVENLPQLPNVLVQFLGVFETASGASRQITYGETLVSIGVGTTPATITAAPVATVNKEGRVAGRYFTSSTGGPTGTLVAYYDPPDQANKPPSPRMAIEKSKIMAGWFNIFVTDTIPFDYVLSETGTVIFGNISLGSGALTNAPGDHKLIARTPAHYQREGSGTTAKTRYQNTNDIVFGFFKDANGPGSFSTYKVCYPASYKEGIVGWYKTSTGTPSKLTDPVIFSSSSPGANDVQVISGGFTTPDFATFATNTFCSNSQYELPFYFHRLNGSDDDFAGIKPPFQLVDPYKRWGGYLRRTFSGSNSIQLNWKYLYGATPVASESGFTGVDILMKYNNNSSTSSNGDTNCNTLKSQGYLVTGSLTTSAETYTFTEGTLTANNQYNYQFAVCPFKLDGTMKLYVGNHIEADCTNCGAFEHYGWGSSITVAGGGIAESSLGIKHARVFDTDASNDLYTIVSLSPSSSYPFAYNDSGGEVMLTVLGERNNASCGSYQGQDINSGMNHFARILKSDAANNLLYIEKGTLADSLSTTHLMDAPSATDFCYVQATKVAHFRDLNITSNISFLSFDYGDSGGGIIPFRVSGMLSVAGGVTIGGTAGGYSGGGAISTGSGHLATTGASFVSGNSGGAGAMSIAGGGAGPISMGGFPYGTSSVNNTINRGIPALSSGNGQFDLLFGGGGGGTISSSGGGGGGIVFLSTRNLVAGGTGIYINATGGSPTNTSAGGGGGGSIVFLSERPSGQTSLQVKGGNTTFVGSYRGGSGGGGTIYNLVCSYFESPTILPNATAGDGGAGGADTAEPGQVVNSASLGSYNPACN